MRIVTHSGVFHTDDVFAVAVLFMRFGREHELVRTRVPEIIASADIVVDVGQEYDEARMRFDHHQGPPLRENGMPYASFGLVWRKWGSELAGSLVAADIVDRRLIQPIDMGDNSMTVAQPVFEGINPYLIQDMIRSLRPTWLESGDLDAAFVKAVELASVVLEREIALANGEIEARQSVSRCYEVAPDKRILVMDKKYPYGAFAAEHPDILFAVFPDIGMEERWDVKTIEKKRGSMESRKDFPESWAGKRDEELAAITGVPEAVFCHRGRFLAVARTKDGAIKLAELAVNS